MGTRPDAQPQDGLSEHRPEFELLPVRLHSVYNSAYPASRNDGALWAGRGLAVDLAIGAAARWGPVSAALAPRILYHENRNFETVQVTRPEEASPYSHPWHPRSIDWPVRFGDRDFWVADLGQTYIRLDAYGFGLGISNENLWWGPAVRYPLLMSNNAPGFPHLFLGTSDPARTPIGEFEVQLIWGRLDESEYFDDLPDGDRRLLAGLVVDYAPRGLPGLYLGAARVLLRSVPPDGLSLRDWLIGPYRRVGENPLGKENPEADNQIFSLFARWAFPAVGFEVYGEWSREDHWKDLRDLALQPDHSQAHMLGFRKTAEIGARRVAVYGESAFLRASAPGSGRRGSPNYYTHSQVRQGYTHRGQLLGSAIGPGSSARILGVDLLTATGLVGIYAERIHHLDDTYRRRWAHYYGTKGRDAEMIAGFRQLIRTRDFDITWDASYARRANRDFLGLDGLQRASRREGNWHLRAGVVWRPDRRGRIPATAIRSGHDGA